MHGLGTHSYEVLLFTGYTGHSVIFRGTASRINGVVI